MKKRGELIRYRASQTSVEFMVILAFVLVVILALFIMNNDMLDSFNGQLRSEKARIVVDNLADAADRVYSMGVGSQTRVYVSIPAGVDSSAVSNRTIRMTILSKGTRNDVYRNTGYQVLGSIPTEEGGYWLTIRSMPGYVMIGYALVEIRPIGIARTIPPGNSSFEIISLRKVVSDDVDVTMTISIDGGINSSLDDTFISLGNATETTAARFTVPTAHPGGLYTGRIIIDAVSPQSTQRMTIPISITVASNSCDLCPGTCPAIQLFPSRWDIGNISRDRSMSKTFYVCSSLPTAEIVSLGFSNPAQLGFDASAALKTSTVNLEPESCATFTAYLNTDNATLGPATSELIASSGSDSDTAIITYQVINASTSGPTVTLISPPNALMTFTRNASFRFNVTSDYAIGSCSLIIDGRSNQTMYNVTHNVTRVFNITDFAFGNHTWTVSCIEEAPYLGVGVAPTRSLFVWVISIYSIPERAWEDDYDPFWTYEVQGYDDGIYGTALDEIEQMPDYVEFDFPSMGINITDAIQSVTFTFVHSEDLQGGFFDEPQRSKIECYDGTSWIYMGTWEWTNISGNPLLTNWTTYTSPNLFACANTYTIANDLHVRIYYDPAFGTGGIQYIDWAGAEINLTKADYVFLWPIATDNQKLVEFTSGINSTANTYGRNSGDDGWDWSRGAFGGPLNYGIFNADPNLDNSIADSTVHLDRRIELRLGGGVSGAPSDAADSSYTGPISSAAYGLQFNITPEQYAMRTSGSSFFLHFDWRADADGGFGDELDSGDEAWIKARLTTPSQTIWLGSNRDSGYGDRDANNEIMFWYDPSDTTGNEYINITSYISATGTYYLELGGMIGDWDSNEEGFGAYFDNVMIMIRK